MKSKELIKKANITIKDHKLKMKDDKSFFNIFSILRNEDEEVMLHSRFIYELLNPKGTHKMEQKYIFLFLTILEIKLPDFSENQLLTATIYREKFNIDLLIYLPDGYTIIIENKIYANDQSAQLERYFNIVVNQCRRDKDKIRIVYLTLDGHEPTKASKGNLKHDIYQISYASEIDNWLKLCCEESSKYPNLFETIKQYRKLVCQLSGNIDSEDGVMMNEVADLILTDKESLESAICISKALNIAKSNVISKILKALEIEMGKANYKKISLDKIELEEIGNYYNSKESICQRYLIKSFSGNYQFCFSFGIEDSLYYSFAFMSKGEYDITQKQNVEKQDFEIYNKCYNAILKVFNIKNIGKSSAYSLKWDYIYDQSGKVYNFKRFSENCIEIHENIDSEAKRICDEMITIIKLVEDEI